MVNELPSKDLGITDDSAEELADLIVKMCLFKDTNPLNQYAALSLAMISTAGLILGIASPPEAIESNKATLLAMLDRSKEIITNLGDEDFASIRQYFSPIINFESDGATVH